MEIYGWIRPTKINYTVLHDVSWYIFIFFIYVCMCHAIHSIYYALYIHDTIMLLNLPMIWVFPQRWFYEVFLYCLWNANVRLLFSTKDSTINWENLLWCKLLWVSHGFFFTARGSTRLSIKSVSGSVLAQINVIEVCFFFRWTFVECWRAVPLLVQGHSSLLF